MLNIAYLGKEVKGWAVATRDLDTRGRFPYDVSARKEGFPLDLRRMKTEDLEAFMEHRLHPEEGEPRPVDRIVAELERRNEGGTWSRLLSWFRSWFGGGDTASPIVRMGWATGVPLRPPGERR